MARLIWTEPAPNDLEAVAEYIALDNPMVVFAIPHVRDNPC